MRPLRSGLVPLVLLLAASGCGFPLLQGNVTADNVCDALPPADEPAAPPVGQQSLTFNVKDDVSAQLSQFLAQAPVSADALELDTLGLKVGDGVSDFGFVESASVELYGADNTQPPLTTFSYQKAAGQPVTDSLVLAPTAKVNLTQVVTSGTVQATVHFVGTMPQVAWRLWATPCFSAQVSFKK